MRIMQEAKQLQRVMSQLLCPVSVIHETQQELSEINAKHIKRVSKQASIGSPRTINFRRIKKTSEEVTE